MMRYFLWLCYVAPFVSSVPDPSKYPGLINFSFETTGSSQVINGRKNVVCKIEAGSEINTDDVYENILIVTGKYDNNCYPYGGYSNGTYT